MNRHKIVEAEDSRVVRGAILQVLNGSGHFELLAAALHQGAGAAMPAAGASGISSPSR